MQLFLTISVDKVRLHRGIFFIKTEARFTKFLSLVAPEVVESSKNPGSSTLCGQKFA